MKVLIAIKGDRPGRLLKQTLAWAPRAGFNLRIFVHDKSKLSKYQNMIEDANYHYYLDLPYTVLVVSRQPRAWAKKENFDLLLLLPDNLSRWHKNETLDSTVISFAVDVGQARLAFSKNPRKKTVVFDNGAQMIRL